MMTNLVGRTLGKYRVVARLGRGGMAEVYKAFQPGLGRFVAIKVMHSYLSEDEEFIKRFHREATATGKLSHPNIVQALDFDQDAGIYFMVMQFINGPTLKDEIRTRGHYNRPLSLPEIGRIYLAVGDAIDYAHSRGMVHRDLKPANMMIDEDGQLLLTDFGIARLLEGTQYTATGGMTGTPTYMSPEQGRGTKVDHRSDIYTLGVILYELATGRVPYDGDTPIATIMKHISEPLPPPTNYKADLPAGVERIICKALAKAPDDRYQTATALAVELRDAVGLQPGDRLRRNPLVPMARSPRTRAELDPHTAQFTPVGGPQPAGRDAVTVAGAPAPATQATRVSPPPRASSPMSLIVMGAVAVVVVAVLAGIGVFAFRDSDNSTTGTGEAAAAVDGAATQTAVAGAGQGDQAATATAVWLSEDTDRDGLTNERELALGTAPDQRDTDIDGIDDLDEIELHQTDPLDSDSDGDSLDDGIEVTLGLNPLDGDTDGDGMFDASDPDPRRGATATSVSAPAATPEEGAVTATTTPIPTEEPTVTPVPAATAAPPAQVSRGPAPLGVFQGFESPSSWRRGDQPYGELTRTSSQTHSGSYAGQLTYNFPTSGNDFVVFLQNRALAGRPTAITAWVYGDGEGHFLNVWVKDSGGQSWTMSFGQIEHTGWQQMTAFLDPDLPWPNGHISGPDNGQIDYPISFQGITLDDGNDGFSGQGTIYIDDLASTEEAVVRAPTPTRATFVGSNNGSAPRVSIAANANFALQKGSTFSYAQPWGAPEGDDVCLALKYDAWDDTQAFYRALTVELMLTNNSTSPVPDDWGGVEFVTANGQRGRFCAYEYAGSGPPPGESRSVTYFAHIQIGDHVQYIQLNNLPGQPLELCLDRRGNAC